MSLINPINISSLLAASFASLEQGQTTKKDALSAELESANTAIQALIAQKAAENGGDIVAARDAVLSELQTLATSNAASFDVLKARYGYGFKLPPQGVCTALAPPNKIDVTLSGASEVILLDRAGAGCITHLSTTSVGMFELWLDGELFLSKTQQSTSVNRGVMAIGEGAPVPSAEYENSVLLKASGHYSMDAPIQCNHVIRG
tara:strand:+ start:13444 stop:14052 length:609 start_codon:yes stop_codon:yes gene_type:complete